nr:hypothetical protein [Tanacetum cinerariifolium]
MELYMQNIEHRRIILESVENGPLIWSTIEENGVTRTMKYAELSTAEKIQADCDMKETNIFLQDLLADIYSLPKFNHSSVPPSYPYQSQMNHQTSSIPQTAYQPPQASIQPMTESPLVGSGFSVPIFSPRDNLISRLNKAIAFLTAVASSRFPSTNNQLRTSSNLRNQDTIQDGRVTVLLVLGETMLMDKQGLLNATTVKTEDLDTYDSDCDDISNEKVVLMANISNYGSDVISEVPHFETYLNDMENQGVHEMQDFKQPPVVDFIDNEIYNDSNINPYS